MRTALICLLSLTMLASTSPGASDDAVAKPPRASCHAAKAAKRTKRCRTRSASCRKRGSKATRRRACRAGADRTRSATCRKRGSKATRRRACRAGAGRKRRSPRREAAPAASAKPPAARPVAPAAGAAQPTAAAPQPVRPSARPSAGGSARPRLFAPDSVWNAPLTNTAPLDSHSPALTAALHREVQREYATGIGPWITETSYSTPLYTVPANQPKVRVVLDTGSWGATLQAALNQGVPIPAGAKPAAGSDGHMTIYEPASDTLWEFWKAVKKPDGWHASWGGVMTNVSQSPGHYTNRSWPGLAAGDGWHWGATATSLPVIAGTILIEELKRGRIDHALALDIPDACAGTFTWPAQRTDGGLTTPDCLPEGAHLRIDPTLDLSTLNLPPTTQILAEAAQRYGMIVRDRTLHATGFYAEDPTPTGTNPYAGPTGFYGGLRPWNFLPQFPWGRLQLLRMTPCTKAPCLPSGTAASARAARTAQSAQRRRVGARGRRSAR
jgi:hypothetical protein